MDEKKVIAAISVIALVLISVWALGANPLENPSTAEKIESEMASVETVQSNTTTTQVISLTNGETIINDTRRQQIYARYNFTQDRFISQGFAEQEFTGSKEQIAYERYYVDETLYTRTASSSNNTTSGWTAQEGEVNLTKRAIAVADADFLSHYNATENDSTIVYEINMLEDEPHINNKLQNRTFTQFDGYKPILDTYVMEIYVNASTYRVEETRIFLQADLNTSELEQIDDVYGQTNQTSTQGRITYASTVKYDAYNEPVNITQPEEINEST